jgi:hypothetical protein
VAKWIIWRKSKNPAGRKNRRAEVDHAALELSAAEADLALAGTPGAKSHL